MRDLTWRVLLSTLALLLVAVAGAMSPARGADCGNGVGPCRCGDVVVTSTTLQGTDPILKTPCACDGLIVAPGVTLVIGGTIRARAGNQCSGIRFAPGTTDAIVRIGRIVGFDIGVDAGEVTGVQIARLLVSDSGTWGILVEGDDNLVESNVVTRSGIFGIDVFGTGNEVRLNRAEETGVIGLIVSGQASAVSRNHVLRSGFDGLVVLGAQLTVERNGSRHNGGAGFGIDGTGHAVILNIAGANGFDGFTVFATGSSFTRNRSNDNGDFGILDLAGGNTYAGNLCAANGAGSSWPPGAC